MPSSSLHFYETPSLILGNENENEEFDSQKLEEGSVASLTSLISEKTTTPVNPSTDTSVLQYAMSNNFCHMEDDMYNYCTCNQDETLSVLLELFMKPNDEEVGVADSHCKPEYSSNGMKQHCVHECYNKNDHQNHSKIQKRLRETMFQKPSSVRTYCTLAAQERQRRKISSEERYDKKKLGKLSFFDNRQNQNFQHSCFFCEVRKNKKQQHSSSFNHAEPNENSEKKQRLLRILLTKFFLHQHVKTPFLVLLDVSEAALDTSLHSTVAIIHLSSIQLQSFITAFVDIVGKSWKNFQENFMNNPIFNWKNENQSHMHSEPTSTVLAAHSSSMAIKINHQHNASESTNKSFLHMKVNGLQNDATNAALSSKLFEKLNRCNGYSTSRVISYVERKDMDVLPEHLKKRVQKMMHYEVPLQPFVATVRTAPSPPPSPNMSVIHKSGTCQKRACLTSYSSDNEHTTTPTQCTCIGDDSSNNTRKNNISNGDLNTFPNNGISLRTMLSENLTNSSNMSSRSRSTTTSVKSSAVGENAVTTNTTFMCTPKSFPPSPSTRMLVMSKSRRFAEDVVFLARDQLRLEGAMESINERTKAMANALREGCRLAVFNSRDAFATGGRIQLSCGYHVATKVNIDNSNNKSNTNNSINIAAPSSQQYLYCSIRSMVPVLRNCYVYFEMTVLPLPPANASVIIPSLSIGLSTLDMALNAMVGTWDSSIGLNTVGQILAAGQRCTPLDPSRCAYGANSTVGCLVYIDDNQAFQTWDGLHVTASISFNVDTHPVRLLQPQQLSSVRILVPRRNEIYPTLTLHSIYTQVMCRFSSDDIIASSRESIGAPSGVVVYGVDGSVLFDEFVDDI